MEWRISDKLRVNIESEYYEIIRKMKEFWKMKNFCSERNSGLTVAPREVQILDQQWRYLSVFPGRKSRGDKLVIDSLKGHRGETGLINSLLK